MGRPSGLASLLGPSLALDEMTNLDILNSARLNPYQRRRSQTTLLLFFMSLSTDSSSLLCYLKRSSETPVLLLSSWSCLQHGNCFPIISQLLLNTSFFFPPLSTERIGWAEYVQQSQLWHEQYQWWVRSDHPWIGRGLAAFALSCLIGSGKRPQKGRIDRCFGKWDRLLELRWCLMGTV